MTFGGLTGEHGTLTECSPNHRSLPTVLLVEDEEDCRWLWRVLLDGDERFGTVSEAGSSREALELMMRDYFDIVITDVGMPGQWGLDLLDILGSRHPMPIVVATSACIDVAPLALDRGASAFWTKVESVSTDMSQHLWTLWRQQGPGHGCQRTALPGPRT